MGRLGLTLRLARERIRFRRFPLGGARPDSATNWRSCICPALVNPRRAATWGLLEGVLALDRISNTLITRVGSGIVQRS